MNRALLLKGFFFVVLVVMLWLTTAASLERGILVALDDLGPDRWFRATLADAYFSFLIIYLWVAWRERTWIARVVWFLAFMGLGSIGIALYFLIQLFRGPEGSVGVPNQPTLGEGLRH